MKQSIFISLFFISTIGVMACNNANDNSESSNEKTTSTTKEEQTMTEKKADPVYEIAVRQVKEGQLDAFKTARTAFITALKKQAAAQTDREFESFYALPEPDKTPVYIGMTKWKSLEGAGEAGQALMASEQAGAFFSTLDFKAYVMVRPIEGGAFDLATLASQPGQVLELAVRRVKDGMEDQFQKTRKVFVDQLNKMDGVLGSWEFEVVGGQNTDRLTVGMSVYASQEAFQKIAGGLSSNQAAGNYFATFDPVALQYAFSTTNQ